MEFFTKNKKSIFAIFLLVALIVLILAVKKCKQNLDHTIKDREVYIPISPSPTPEKPSNNSYPKEMRPKTKIKVATSDVLNPSLSKAPAANSVKTEPKKEQTLKDVLLQKFNYFSNTLSPKAVPTVLPSQIPMQPALVEKEELPINTCFTIAYKHNKAANHLNADDCSNHKNQFKFIPNKNHPEIANKNLCVKVDGIVIKFQQKNNSFLIGPGAGPESIITLRYCPSHLMAANDCKLPPDSFATALGVELGQSDTNPEVRWDDSDQEPEINVDEELGPELNPNKIDGQGLVVFDGWVESSSKADRINL